jgi:hypothetical protein
MDLGDVISRWKRRERKKEKRRICKDQNVRKKK